MHPFGGALCEAADEDRSAKGDAADGQLAGRPSGAQPPVAAELEGSGIERLAGRFGDQHLASLGGLADPGRDVDVDAQVVAADPSWPSEVNSGAKLRLVPVHLDAAQLGPVPGVRSEPPRSALLNTAMAPSPSRFTRLPRCVEIAASSAVATWRSSSSAASSPASSAQEEKPTMSVNRIATSTFPRPRPCASESACQAWRAPSPSSRSALGRSGSTSETRRPILSGTLVPLVDSESP